MCENYSELSKRGGKAVAISKAKVLCNYFPLELTKDIEEIYIFGI